MRAGTSLLPRTLSDSPLSARLWLALSAAAGSAVCAYAGLYPRFDEGSLRLVIGVTSAPFAAAVVAYALSARTTVRALGAALAGAFVLGAASTVIPALILTWNHPGEMGIAAFFGAFFGGATGVTYGVPLAILASLGHRHVHAQTHEGNDRAARIAGLWLFVAAAIGVTGTCLLDKAKMDWHTDTLIPASPLPALVGCAVAITGSLVFLVATLRGRRRAAWLGRVGAGLEPSFRLRRMELRDQLAGLPRLGSGSAVVEFIADVPGKGALAYRTSAMGTAIAIAPDDMCTFSTGFSSTASSGRRRTNTP